MVFLKIARRKLNVLKLTMLNPRRPKEGGLSQRERSYRRLLKSVSPGKRKKLMARRKAISRARKGLIAQVELSVSSVAAKYPNFKGIFLFGGVPRGKKHSGDIDYRLVFGKQTEETRGKDREAAMLLWNKLEDFTITDELGSLYLEAQAGSPMKFEATGALKGTHKRRGVYPWDFIGDQKTKERIMRIFETEPPA